MSERSTSVNGLKQLFIGVKSSKILVIVGNGQDEYEDYVKDTQDPSEAVV